MKARVYSEHCPSRNILEAISDKWSILILTILIDNTLRFGQLKREIGGISSKMLTQTLHKLEKLSFIHKEVYQEITMRVEYSLTCIGKELGKILQELTTWTENNMEIILSEKTLH